MYVCVCLLTSSLFYQPDDDAAETTPVVNVITRRGDQTHWQLVSFLPRLTRAENGAKTEHRTGQNNCLARQGIAQTLVCLCVCVCVRICTYVCMYLVFVFVRTCVSVCACTCVCASKPVYVDKSRNVLVNTASH